MTTALALSLALLAVGDLPPVAPPVAPAPRVARDDSVKTPAPAPKRTPTSWSRVDSRGATWTHTDRAYLDNYVDAVERRYAGAGGIYTTPGANYTAAGATCVGGSCGVPSSSFRLFGRR